MTQWLCHRRPDSSRSQGCGAAALGRDVSQTPPAPHCQLRLGSVSCPLSLVQGIHFAWPTALPFAFLSHRRSSSAPEETCHFTRVLQLLLALMPAQSVFIGIVNSKPLNSANRIHCKTGLDVMPSKRSRKQFATVQANSFPQNLLSCQSYLLRPSSPVGMSPVCLWLPSSTRQLHLEKCPPATALLLECPQHALRRQIWDEVMTLTLPIACVS